MRSTLRGSIAGLALLAVGAAGAGAQTNLVTNGGFESGLTGWTIDPSDCSTHGTFGSVTTTTTAADSGVNAASFTATDCVPRLTQTIAVTPGHFYQIDYFHDAPDGPPAGTTVGQAGNYFGLFVTTDSPYCGMNGGGTQLNIWLHDSVSGCSFGNATSITLGVGAFDNYGPIYIDDVSVTDLGGTSPSSAPEPASLALLGTGLVGLAPFARRRLRGQPYVNGV